MVDPPRIDWLQSIVGRFYLLRCRAVPMRIIFILLIGMTVARHSALATEIAKWERAIANLAQRDQTEGASADGILFYGSSSIRLWNSIAQDISPWQTIQRGYGGAKLPDILHYAPRVIGPRLGDSNPRRCKALVLFVANDIVGRETDKSPEEVADLFFKLHQWIRQQDCSLPIFWIEVTPTPSRWDVWENIELGTKLIRTILQNDPNGHLISTAGAFLGVDGRPRPELFIKDQLHLNADGYQQWAILIKAQLHAKLGAAKPVLAEPIETEGVETQERDVGQLQSIAP